MMVRGAGFAVPVPLRTLATFLLSFPSSLRGQYGRFPSPMKW